MLQERTKASYEAFLDGCAKANYCHDPAWPAVFREAYGKKGFILLWRDPANGNIGGAAPACEVSSLLFGRNLVCMPFLDYGGIAAPDPEVQSQLRKALLAEASARRADLEIRCFEPLAGLDQTPNVKVAMMLSLGAEGTDAYWKSLDAKVRNQVRKAEKSSVTVRWGRDEYLDD